MKLEMGKTYTLNSLDSKIRLISEEVFNSDEQTLAKLPFLKGTFITGIMRYPCLLVVADGKSVKEGVWFLKCRDNGDVPDTVKETGPSGDVNAQLAKVISKIELHSYMEDIGL